MSDTPPQAMTQLIISLALPIGAAMIFVVLGFVLPIEPFDPQVNVFFLGGAAVLGIVGPALGKLIRGKLAFPPDYATYLQQSLPSTLVSLAIREAGVILAALYVHFGGVFFRGAGVAGIIILTMLLDARTPSRTRAEYETLVGRIS